MHISRYLFTSHSKHSFGPGERQPSYGTIGYHQLTCQKSASPSTLQEQTLLYRRSFHLICLNLRIKRTVFKIVKIQIHVSVSRPLARRKEYLSSIDAQIGHESEQKSPAVFLRCERHSRLLHFVKSTGGQDGCTDVPAPCVSICG
jgi:hypothetical protein